MCQPWQAYLNYYPDVHGYGGGTAASFQTVTRQHYLQAGHLEARVYKRLQVLLRYTTCGGVIQQHYAHVAGLALALALGADVTMPPALVQDADLQPAMVTAKHHAEPVGSLWDYNHLVR